jgi:hypothetical protein
MELIRSAGAAAAATAVPTGDATAEALALVKRKADESRAAGKKFRDDDFTGADAVGQSTTTEMPTRWERIGDIYRNAAVGTTYKPGDICQVCARAVSPRPCVCDCVCASACWLTPRRRRTLPWQ